jgi:phosphoribosylamine---glycine ligase
VLPRLRTDLGDVLARACDRGGLGGVALDWAPDWAVTLVLASAGYPESASKGDVISGLADVPDGVEVTHAGTARRGEDVVTAGGRVLNVTALGPDPAAARDAAYAAADRITFEGRQLRRDIALRAVERAA